MSFDNIIHEKEEACLVGLENVLIDEMDEVLIAEEIMEAGAWDPSLFAELADSWKVLDGQRKCNVNRLQDLSFGLEGAGGYDDTTIIVQQQYSEGWPFESSPCRLFGGKNTKKNSQSAADINQRLFNPDFANSQHTCFQEFAETDTQLSFDVSKTADGVGSVWGNDDTVSSSNSTTHCKRRSRDSRRDFKRRRSCGDIRETQQLGNNKTASAALMKRNLSSDQIELSFSRGAPSGRASPLPKSNSDHPKAYRNTSSSSNSNKNFSGALISGAHHRRRPSIQRAISVENVVPPDQFCQQPQTHQQNTPLAVASAAADAAANIYTSTIYRGAVSSDHHHPRRRRRPARQVSAKQKEEKSAETTTSTEADGNYRAYPQHTHYCSSEDCKSASLNIGVSSDACDIDTDSKTSAQLASQNDSESNRNCKPGRDLRELFLTGNQADVTIDDLSCVANRRFLHSVIYQHKLGLRFAALRTKIQREIKEDPVKALERPERPLFVEIPM